MNVIRPLRDHVLVKQDKPKEKTTSGLFMPQGARESYDDIGTIIAVGPGKVLENGTVLAPAISVGDRVIFKRRPASVLDEPALLLMLKEEDILGVIYEE